MPVVSAELNAARAQWRRAWSRAIARCDAGELLRAQGRDAMPAAFVHAPRPWLLSIGKAAVSMHAAARQLVPGVQRELVIAPAGVDVPRGWDFVHRGDHPVVGPASLRAGRAVLTFADDAVKEDAAVYGLISGGASALCEAPTEGVTSAHLRECSRRWLAEGLGIEELNAARSRLSAIKGGKLARRFGHSLTGASVLVDVPSGRAEVVGSGPLAGPRVPLQVLARPVDLARAMARELDSQRWAPAPRELGVDMPLKDLLALLVRWIGRASPGDAWLGGGEVALRIPPAALRRAGGRARHFALACALALSDALPGVGWLVFAGASDGRDGSGGAGAVVTSDDPLGDEARRALASYDSGSFCDRHGLGLPERHPTTNLSDVYAVALIG